MKTERALKLIKALLLLLTLGFGLFIFFIRGRVNKTLILLLAAFCALILLVLLAWDALEKRRLSRLANDICETADALMEGKPLTAFHPYEDSEISKIQAKLLRYYEAMEYRKARSLQDKQTIQELVSDISHQVKTPVANLQMFTEILRQHDLSPEKRGEFLDLLKGQADKLDFLMQSLVKMSRLETGTFTITPKNTRLYDTIAAAVNSLWTKAENKGIRLEVDCGSSLTVKHDPKWTAEALENILDNAVKYTPPGGSVSIRVTPWQFYTRIDITDTGMGIEKEHYNDVFQRFYRAQEAASTEGVGLGLYLAQGIITRQKGYITVSSSPGKGSTFSVFLLSTY